MTNSRLKIRASYMRLRCTSRAATKGLASVSRDFSLQSEFAYSLEGGLTPSPHLERGDMAYCARRKLPCRHLTKKGTKNVEGVRAEKNPRKSRGNGFCRRSSSNVLFDSLKKTSDHERSCVGKAWNASIHDQHFPSNNLLMSVLL